ncbi:hypothetical protein AAV94_13750 [Lampropedia cohaerens]|uniref:Ribosomal RNA small subunit methyltransferase E n=1 Tax=Lampropedia cohaerens TaxID=1610491 RepID=A0A0U1PWM6_9BURK|nr:16S rRNA (uracil(1498)-N(3))-methyltransferase [Lampropedia cohaerens]KKW66891.1 hypothetical protein AAV94_13750 [Lampropedia cohaerens]
MPRIYCTDHLQPGLELDLPSGAARHVQVLRMQPGQALCLFPGTQANGEFTASILEMGRQHVRVRVEQAHTVDREAALALHLAVGMPANDRMDWLVEKATELGVARITPLMTERSVLRLKAERADKKRQHWQAIAIAACEQSGRNTVPVVDAPCTLAEFVATVGAAGQPAHSERWVLSLAADARPVTQRLAALPQPCQGTHAGRVLALSGPEGGLSAPEETLLRAQGFSPVSLGARTLRADTAAIALTSAATLYLPEKRAHA